MSHRKKVHLGFSGRLGDEDLNHPAGSRAAIDRYLVLPFACFFASTSERAQLRSLAALAFFVLGLSGMMYRVAFPVISVLPWDIAIQLDGAWRIVHGQIPSVDFRSVIPPITLELSALAIVLGSRTANCIAYGNLLLFVLLTPWAWLIARQRVSAAYAFAFSAFVGLVLLTPRPLGDKIAATSYAMLYNRQGWAVLSVLLFSLLVPLRRDSAGRDYATGLVNGVLLALLAFSKLNFFAVGVTAVGVHLMVRPREPVARLLAVALGCSSTMILLHAVAALDFTAYAAETLAIAKVYVHGKLLDMAMITLKNIDQVFIVAALTVLCLRQPIAPDQRTPAWSKGALLLSIVFVCASALALTATSAQDTDIPLLPVAGLMCIEWMRRIPSGRIAMANLHARAGYLFGATILLPLLIGPLLGKDTIALLQAATLTASEKEPKVGIQRFHSAALHDFVIRSDRTVISEIAPSQPAAIYPRQINDGIDLLRRYARGQDRIMALDFSNPFPFALDLPPVRGGSISWLLDASFSKSIYAAPEAVFGDANLLMIPRYERNAATVAALREIYADYLKGNFRLVDRTEVWELYERSAGRSAEPNRATLSLSDSSIRRLSAKMGGG
jgi:hypothetical protein